MDSTLSILDQCVSTTSLDGDDLSESLENNQLIIFCFQCGEKYEGYDRDNLKHWFDEGQEKIFYWKSGTINNKPVYKIPYNGIWVDSTVYNLVFQDNFSTIYIYPKHSHAIGSQGGASRLHGAVEMIYSGFPIGREKLTHLPSLREIVKLLSPGPDDVLAPLPPSPTTILTISPLVQRLDELSLGQLALRLGEPNLAQSLSHRRPESPRIRTISVDRLIPAILARSAAVELGPIEEEMEDSFINDDINEFLDVIPEDLFQGTKSEMFDFLFPDPKEHLFKKIWRHKAKNILEYFYDFFEHIMMSYSEDMFDLFYKFYKQSATRLVMDYINILKIVLDSLDDDIKHKKINKIIRQNDVLLLNTLFNGLNLIDYNYNYPQFLETAAYIKGYTYDMFHLLFKQDIILTDAVYEKLKTILEERMARNDLFPGTFNASLDAHALEDLNLSENSVIHGVSLPEGSVMHSEGSVIHGVSLPEEDYIHDGLLSLDFLREKHREGNHSPNVLFKKTVINLYKGGVKEEVCGGISSRRMNSYILFDNCLDLGANPNLEIAITNSMFIYPLRIAIRIGSIQMIKRLAEHMNCFEFDYFKYSYSIYKWEKADQLRNSDRYRFNMNDKINHFASSFARLIEKLNYPEADEIKRVLIFEIIDSNDLEMLKALTSKRICSNNGHPYIFRLKDEIILSERASPEIINLISPLEESDPLESISTLLFR